MSKVKIVIHTVFGTKFRRTTIPEECRRDVYKIIYNKLKDEGCFVHRINGTSNHVHILFELPASAALSELIRTIKATSSAALKAEPAFKYWEGWAKEYFAESVAPEDIPRVKQYIINQETHHGLISYEDEMSTYYNRRHWIFKPEYLD